jgi:UDP-glucose 4-epimerase
LITGGAGYIGSHTAWLLARQGHQVIILDSLRYGQLFIHSWATFIQGDCGDTAVLDTIFSTYKIDAVMHFAASIEVGESVRSPLSFYENNVANSITLLKAMCAHGVCTFIFSSSCAVYGIPQKLPITEDHPKNPINPYGRTKLMVEEILEDLHHAHGLNYVILRYFNAAGAAPEYGLGERHIPETHLIPLLLQAAVQGTPFTLFGTQHATSDGSCVRDFVHVLDIAHAHLQALAYLELGGNSDSFNLGTGQGVSVKQLIAVVEAVVDKKVVVVHKDPRLGDPAILVADASKAKRVLAWQPRYSAIEHVLKTAYEFAYLEQSRSGG